MPYGFTEIDHLLGAVQDPQAGGDRYERLGFTVTPISIIAELGVGNRLVLLHPLTDGTANFFECMGMVDPERVPPSMKRLLGGEEGIRSMVLTAPDTNGTHRALLKDGHRFDAPIDISRNWRLPSGETLRPSFRVTIPAPAPLPFNFCQYHTLELYLREKWLCHENGARHLISVMAMASDSTAMTGHFEKLFGVAADTRNGISDLGPGRVKLRLGDRRALEALIPPEWLPDGDARPRYIGFEIEVTSLAALRKLFETRGIHAAERAGAVLVTPEEACGNILRFVEPPAN